MRIVRASRAFALLCLTALLFLSACAAQPGETVAQSCVASGGKWLAEAGECEIGEKSWCEAQSGRFNPCASPCRHSTKPLQPCAAICVPVCAFPKK
jgi:hypothetical protein